MFRDFTQTYNHGTSCFNRLIEMSRWMGLHLLWIDYNNLSGYIFIRVTRMGSHTFEILRLRKFLLLGI